MAINGAIGLNLTLLEFYTLALQSVDRVQATAEQVSTGRRLTKGMITSVWVFCNEKYQSLIQKGMITNAWVFCNESSISNDRFAKELGISIAGEKLDCRDMQSFSAQVGSN